MGTPKTQKIAQRARAAQLFDLGWSLSLVSNELGIGRSTAEDWRKQYNHNRTAFTNRPEKPRKRRSKFSLRDVQKIEDFASAHPRSSYRAIAHDLHLLDLSSSAASVWRYAKKAGQISFLTPKKPRLSKVQKEQRRTFSTDKRGFPWPTVVFSDEFEISTNGQSIWYRASSHDKVPPMPAVKFAPKLQFWAAITYNSVLPLEFFTGKLNAPKYQRILDSGLRNAAQVTGGHEYWLLHDKAPWHTAHSTQEYLQHSHYLDHFFTPDEYPGNSPDLNVIENLMGTVSRRVKRRSPRSKEQLRQYLLDEWSRVTPDELHSLYDSMETRLAEVRKKKGGNTRF
jgi:transposase